MISNENKFAPATKRRALIIISSGRQLPLSEPAEVKSISTGFFLIELAQVLKEFENEYEFTFATPDGNSPQLDINGLALVMHSVANIGYKTIPMRAEQFRSSYTVDAFRKRHSKLVARREQEVQLLERHLGRIPVSELLPNGEPELIAYRAELVSRLEKLPQTTFHSLPELVQRHRDPADPFKLTDFDFIHNPGGNAPMIDFRDNPWLGEILHVARENGVIISLICHAPVAVTSTRQRVDEQGRATHSSPQLSRPSLLLASSSHYGISTCASLAKRLDLPILLTRQSKKLVLN